jgi:hypothetical protein
MFRRRVLQLAAVLAISAVVTAFVARRRAAPLGSVGAIAVAAAAEGPAHVPDPFLDAWTPPAGIPAPDFGIAERAPAPPAAWNSPVANFYYVDATQKAATDDGNPNGTPARPRRTIPLVLPAGAVVELRGVYDYFHSSPRTLTLNGTRERPVFIRGAGPGNRPQIRQIWELHGSYAILENLEFAPLDANATGALRILAPATHIALRGSELHGNLTGGGLGVGSWAPNIDAEHVVIVGNRIHDNGDVNASFDQDVHGIAVGDRAHHIWVVDNELARNSGDGIQINAGNSRAAMALTHHIYVGRNIAHHNKQSGFWTKQAVDVIFSQNLCYAHRPGNSSMGSCMGQQYSPERVWFISNHIHDSEFGIALAGDSDRGFGQSTFMIGNVIHNIHHVAKYNPQTGWSQAGIMMAGGQLRVVLNNTIDDVDAGITSPTAGITYIVNNIISGIREEKGCHIFLEMAAGAARSTMRNNLLTGPVRIRWGGERPFDLAGFRTAVPRQGVECLIDAPGFVNPSADDFRLTPASAARHKGAPEAAKLLEAYNRQYGVALAADLTNLGAFDESALQPSRRAR